MVNAALMEQDRNTRRRALREEEMFRKSGDWGPWETMDVPPGAIGGRQGGWPEQMKLAHRNRVFCVLERTLVIPPGGVRHLGVSSLSGIRPTFHEMQRIKNELAGNDATAIEIYPPQRELIDAADMFHIWVLPAGLPFGL
jgi:hypothetical protein